ncbi:MAG: ABC transporter ATP-binding protein [Methanomassiliicoccus sp.]|nr:ABC transporter ATP-binding protein [Methanomassiliicoccus sp.]
MSFLNVMALSKAFRSGDEETLVLSDLALSVERGEMVMIMGPSGSGKTTLLNAIGGIERPDAGSIIVDGREITLLDRNGLNDYRRTDVGFVFQFYNLIPTLTALENVMLAIEGRGFTRVDARERSIKELEAVGMVEKLDSFPQQLSAGQQQRVAIARALVKRPKLVLADEPTGNLDEGSEGVVLDVLTRASKELGTSFVVVSHNFRLRERMDRCYELRRGRLIEA